MYQIVAKYKNITAYGQVDAPDEQMAAEQAKTLLFRPMKRKYPSLNAMPKDAVIAANLIPTPDPVDEVADLEQQKAEIESRLSVLQAQVRR